MRRITDLAPLLLAVLLSCLHSQGVAAQQAVPANASGPAAVADGIAVYFSPSGGCTQAIMERIGQAKQTVQVQAYSFTSASIAKALADAHARGVQVTVVLDASQRTDRYSGATYLFNHGVPTFIDARHAIAHNKIILIDGQTIITGSFNFTKAAEESNAENLLIIDGKPDLMAAYVRNFQSHRDHASRYAGPTGQAAVPARAPPTATAAPQARPEAQVATVYITRTGKRYHAAGCSSLSRSSFPISLSDVKAKGYTPCSRCGGGAGQ